ncbi:MAG: hypothetical protein K0S19_2044 [Geminicoccaceae bacterium]|nr:hypothetical protein [Geminicoccaceae bacterium]
MNCVRISYRVEHRGRSPHRKVFLGRPHVSTRQIDRDATPFTPFRHDRVGQADETEQGFDAVISILLPSQDPQKEIDLGRSGDRYRRWRHAGSLRKIWNPSGVRAMDQRPNIVIGTKEVMWKEIA